MYKDIAQRLERTVVAVPPVAWTDQFELNEAENKKLINHITAGGVTALLYGGNANIYHYDMGRFDALMDLLSDVDPSVDVIPSIGPDLGKLLDGARRLRGRKFAGVMALPMTFPAQPSGVEKGIRMAADALGAPLILYIKRDGYLHPDQVASMLSDGAVCFVKYAVERPDPRNDQYLADLCSAIGSSNIASGMGETPIHVHFPEYKVRTYTSGGVCIAPSAAMALRRAYAEGNQARADELAAPFLEYERVRAAINGFSVMHDAPTVAGIANMGPMLPMCTNVDEHRLPEMKRAVDALVAIDQTCKVTS